mmetsp:Transcript_11004/g.12470  ORF Transcript_11004/g.12470 Transcript_11004/m.12470 type:complete len:125 (+) Transcript_11004:342-716(+)
MSDINIARLYLLLMMKLARAKFSPYIDKGITILDFKGSGLSNLALGMFKNLNPELSNIFPLSTHKNLLVHPNWILNMGWKVAQTILSEHQLKKIHFIDDATLLDSMLEEADIDNIPEEYGGNFV